MGNKSRLDEYWNDFLTNFIESLLADGYNEFEILDKIMSVFKSVRNSKCQKEDTNNVPITYTSRKYPINKKNPSRIKNPHNYDKTLHYKFEHAQVYVLRDKENSLATIEAGPSHKVKDVYQLVSTGEKLSESEYLRRFNTPIEETPKGYRWLNRMQIIFVDNPNISVGYVKNPKNYSKFNSIDDIKQYNQKFFRKV